MNTDCQHILMTGCMLILALLIITYIGKRHMEPFEIEPQPQFDVLLEYPLQQSIHATDVNYGGLNKYIYTTPLASYEQVTNNKKNWNNPEDGSALFPEINGTSMYA